MFQIKDFRSIVASMINVARASQTKITDFSVGSVSRTLMESPAVEIEELYLQMLLGLMDAIPVSIYRAFDFQVIDARPSSGILTIHFPGPLPGSVVLPLGSAFSNSTASLVFSSTSTVTAAAGSTSVDLVVVCSVPGLVGNINLNEITSISGSTIVPNGSTFTNLPFISGSAAESELERKTRFVEFIRSISRGTVESIRYAVSTATVTGVSGLVQESVAFTGISEVPGYVSIYIYGSAGHPSAELIARAQALIDGYIDPISGAKVSGYRSAGVAVTVLPMVNHEVSIGLTVNTQYDAEKTTALRNRIIDTVARMIVAVLPGATLRAESITNSILSISGVMACNLTNNTNVTCNQFERLTVGTVTVGWTNNA